MGAALHATAHRGGPRPCRHAVGNRWFVDETYVKVAGVWRYVYRAVDQLGQVIDIYVSTRRDLAAARHFFEIALRDHGRPAELVTVHKWLLRHKRFHLHFTPTYGSWMNVVERWFSALTTKKMQRSAHRSVKELATDIKPGPRLGTKTLGPSSGTRPSSRSSNDWPATAPPATKPPHDPTN